jgi:hypothetical protein
MDTDHRGDNVCSVPRSSDAPHCGVIGYFRSSFRICTRHPSGCIRSCAKPYSCGRPRRLVQCLSLPISSPLAGAVVLLVILCVSRQKDPVARVGAPNQMFCETVRSRASPDLMKCVIDLDTTTLLKHCSLSLMTAITLVPCS